MRGAIWLGVAWLLFTGTASAEGDTSHDNSRTVSVFDEVGVAAPYGWAGFGLGLRLLPSWSVELGVGLDWGGFQVGVGTDVHWVFPNGETLGLFLAGSRDTYVEHQGLFSSHDYKQTWDTVWGYLGVHGRKHIGGVAFVRGTIGITSPFWHSSYACEVSNDTAHASNLAACMRSKFSGTLSGFGGVGLEFELF